MDKDIILKKILQVLDLNKGADGWIDLAVIGTPLVGLGVNYKALGYLKLRDLLEEFGESIEIRRDETSHKLPVLYARLRQIAISESQQIAAARQPASGTYAKRTVKTPQRLLDWAWMGDFHKVVNCLKSMALQETWHYKTQDPTHPFPILSNYLLFTFFRLSKEHGKIKTTDKYAAFNTGLVNNLYEPIYALFEKNRNSDKQEWYFHEFCVSGAGKVGKLLASTFNPLPERAHYFSNPSDLIYDSNAPEPSLDWNHIIIENVERLPIAFLKEHTPDGFSFKDVSTMDTIERAQYYDDLSAAIQNDGKKFRTIKNRLSDSLDLALKRVEWNFKTAIPVYYPTTNKMSLLLPLSLNDDERIDLALVVEKTPSGSYLGHTILPLDWAYNNARLITRPDSDWLVAEKIEGDIADGVEDEVTDSSVN